MNIRMHLLREEVGIYLFDFIFPFLLFDVEPHITIQTVMSVEYYNSGNE